MTTLTSTFTPSGSRVRLALALSLVAASIAFGTAATAQRRRRTPEAYYQEEFIAAVQRNMPVLQPCYDRYRTEADAAWRRLQSVTVVINPDGTVGRITPIPGPGAPTFEECARPIFQRWHLTPIGGNTGITLTYTHAQLERAMSPAPARPTRR